MSNPPVFHFAARERPRGTAALGSNRGTTKMNNLVFKIPLLDPAPSERESL